MIKQIELKEKLQKEQIDISLPTREEEKLDSKIHPITHTISEIISILGNMGLNYEEGPDIENDFYMIYMEQKRGGPRAPFNANVATQMVYEAMAD